MAQLNEQQAVQYVNDSFKQWGIPKKIKIDNGKPFVHPGQRDLPTMTILWWVGLGIEVIQNDPGCPQQNAIVEGLQDTCYRWAAPQKQYNLDALQKSLDEAGRIHREVYQLARRGYKTRIQLYPDLMDNPRSFSHDLFDMNRVYTFLSQKVWQRKVKTAGTIKVFNQEIYVGSRFGHWPVTVTFDPIEHQWMIRATDGRLLKASNKALIQEEQIWEHVQLSKN